MSNEKSATGTDDGITLSPDAPIGEPEIDQPNQPVREPAPGDGGIIAPGSTPESR